MSASRRYIPILAIFSAVLVIYFTLYRPGFEQSWKNIAPAIGLGEYSWPLLNSTDSEPSPDDFSFDRLNTPKPLFQKGKAKPPGSKYSKVLIVPKLHDEDTEWIDEELPNLDTAIYVADNPDAPLHPPKNKGHEVMIYLSYIIDHYDDLPEIMIFMHSHRYSWHNDDILDYDAVQMIKRLSSERVSREGYMNMRCQWDPGCPDWMHPGETEANIQKQEEILLARTWAEIFPLDPVPKVLAQPCCAQFALSKARVQSIPKRQFIYYRDWLLRTPLKDFVSGRVWEYMWQFAFTGKNVVCPVQHACYCDGFGVCFGGKEQYKKWFEVRNRRDDLNDQLREWNEKGKKIEDALANGEEDEAAKLEKPEPGLDTELKPQISALQKEMDKLKNDAIERGKKAENRAMEAGRPWKEGDGF